MHQQLGPPLARPPGCRPGPAGSRWLRRQRQLVNVAAEVPRPGARHRVAGHGHERHVAGVDERGRQHGVDGLGADAVAHLRHRVEGDAELPQHERRRRFLERGDAVVGVPAVLDPVDLDFHPLPHRLGRPVVVFADAEVEQRHVGPVGDGLPLGPLDLLELVDVGALAVLGTADAVGEQGLGTRGRRPCVRTLRKDAECCSGHRGAGTATRRPARFRQVTARQLRVNDTLPTMSFQSVNMTRASPVAV